MKHTCWLSVLLILLAAAAPAAATNRAQTVEQALVLIRTEAGQGTGFLGSLGGTNYIITNTHVLENSRTFHFETLQGRPLKPLRLELAAQLDLARVLVAETNLAPLSLAGEDFHLGDPIEVYGNSLGMSAATKLTGTVLGIGPELVEVSAGFVPGNSGSPILTTDGLVIGVATFMQREDPDEVTLQGTRFANPRRYGLRLTPHIPWQPLSPAVLYEESSVFHDVATLTEDLRTLDQTLDENQGQLTRTLKMYAADTRNERFARRYRNQEYPRLLGAFATAYAEYLKSKDAGFSEQSHAARTSRRQMENTMRQLVSLPLKNLKAVRWSIPAFSRRAQETIAAFTFMEGRLKELIGP